MLKLGSMLFLWFAVGGFEIALGTRFYSSLLPMSASPCGSGPCPSEPDYSPCIPGQPCGSRQPFYPSRPKPRRPVFPAKFSYKKRTSKDPCISSFVCTFVDKVRACPQLTELFNYFQQTSAEDFACGKYPEFLDAFTAIGASNPEFASQQAVETITDCFDILCPEVVIQVYANFVAKYLFTQGALTPQNSVQLATQYADTMEEAASCNDSPYTALKEGFVNFLHSLGLFTADKVLLISLQYANEWKMVAAKPKYG